MRLEIMLSVNTRENGLNDFCSKRCKYNVNNHRCRLFNVYLKKENEIAKRCKGCIKAEIDFLRN